MTITCVQTTKGPCKVTQQKISLTNVNKPFCKVTKVTVSEVSLMILCCGESCIMKYQRRTDLCFSNFESDPTVLFQFQSKSEYLDWIFDTSKTLSLLQ